ncbi:Holliday junction resolvase RuvX [Mariniluteicoccus endophyticus]
MGDLRPGVRLALDWGDARIGVAACDAMGVLAYPVETVQAGPQSLTRLLALVAEYEPVEIIVGLPRNMNGTEGGSAAKIREHAGSLARAVVPVQVRLLDERLTTVTASRTLTQQGRKAKKQRSVIDQVAAVTILEHALEAERRTGTAPGEAVTESGAEERNER